MRSKFSSLLFLFFIVFGFSQENKTYPYIFPNGGEQIENNEEIDYKPARYPGGTYNLDYDVGKAIKYPKKAMKNGIEGEVIIRFAVNTDGTMSDIAIKKDIGYGCGEEAKKAFESLEKRWIPAKINGKSVKQYYRRTVRFILRY